MSFFFFFFHLLLQINIFSKIFCRLLLNQLCILSKKKKKKHLIQKQISVLTSAKTLLENQLFPKLVNSDAQIITEQQKFFSLYKIDNNGSVIQQKKKMLKKWMKIYWKICLYINLFFFFSIQFNFFINIID